MSCEEVHPGPDTIISPAIFHLPRNALSAWKQEIILCYRKIEGIRSQTNNKMTQTLEATQSSNI